MRRELAWQFRRVTQRWPHRRTVAVRGNATGRLVDRQATRPGTALVAGRGRSAPKAAGGSRCRGCAAGQRGNAWHSRHTRGGSRNSRAEFCASAWPSASVRLRGAEAEETMRMVAVWLNDVLRLAVGEYDRLRLSESRLGGGLKNIIASLPSEAKLAVPGRCDGE